MAEGSSRRELLGLAAAAVAAAGAVEVAASDFTNRLFVTHFEVALATAGGGFKVRLLTSTGRVFDIELVDPETKAQFMRLVELALGGRGRMTLEVETDGKTIRSFHIEGP